MKERASEQAIVELERVAWREYAQPRWGMGSRMELAQRALFARLVESRWRRLREQARRGGQALECSLERLRLLAVRGLEKGCEYCGEIGGVDGVAIVLDVPAGRTNSRPFRLANLACCCRLCELGKGSLSGDEWRDVLAALRAADESAATSTRQALAVGRAKMRGQGTSRGPTPCG